jgi:hypothetical protein
MPANSTGVASQPVRIVPVFTSVVYDSDNVGYTQQNSIILQGKDEVKLVLYAFKLCYNH